MNLFKKLLSVTLALLLALTLIACERDRDDDDEDDEDDAVETTIAETTEPATVAPETTEPATVEPETTEPPTTEPPATEPPETEPVTTDPPENRITADELLDHYLEVISTTLAYEAESLVKIQWVDREIDRTVTIDTTTFMAVDFSETPNLSDFSKLKAYASENAKMMLYTANPLNHEEAETDSTFTIIDGMLYMKMQMGEETVMVRLTEDEMEDASLELNLLESQETEDPRKCFEHLSLDILEDGYVIAVEGINMGYFYSHMEETVILPLQMILGFSDYTYNAGALSGQFVFDEEGMLVSSKLDYKFTIMADGAEADISVSEEMTYDLTGLTTTITAPENADDYLTMDEIAES